MYDPLALDRQRIELERLRRHAESASRRLAPAESSTPESADRHLRVLRRSRRRPATAC
jgi:hypothetical protein